MKTLVATLVLAALAGCGLDAVGGAATGAAIKKQELEQGKKTMEQMQKSIGQAMDMETQRARSAGDEK